MQQVLHIFRKDCRHLWPEAVACLIATIDFARVYPAQWMPDAGLHLSLGSLMFPALSMTTVSGVLTALVPISWFVLIVRVVQDEALVGAKLYWVTRPYEWRKLLAAKVLFLLLFLAVPFAGAQVAILAEAGFHPMQHALGLLWMIAMSLLTFALPMVSLATVTRSFLQAALSLLALCVLVIALALFVEEGPWSSQVSTPSSGDWSFPVYVLVCAAVVGVQYASRRVWLARGLALSLFLAIAVLAIDPAGIGRLENSYYPDAPGSVPVHLSIPPVTAQTRPDREPAVTDGDTAKLLNLSLPLEISGVPEDSIVTPDNVRLRVVAADGTSWTSPWHSIYGHEYRQETKYGAVSVQVDRAFLDRVRSRPVRLELSLALTQMKAVGSFSTILPTNGDVVAPGFGRCNQTEGATGGSAGLHCRFPLGEPRKTLVSALFTGKPCPTQPATMRMFPMTALDGSLEPDRWDPFLASVRDAELSFGDSAGSDSPSHYNGYLCPGTPIRFTRYRAGARARYSIRAENVLLPR